MIDHLAFLDISMEFVYVSITLRIMLWTCVFIAVLMDLWHGIKKSKKEGIYTHSRGMKATVSKANKYFSFLMFAFIFDIFWHIASVQFIPASIAVIPVFTLATALLLVRIEYISVKETLDEKMLTKINKSKDDLTVMLSNFAEAYQANPNIINTLANMSKNQINDRAKGSDQNKE